MLLDTHRHQAQLNSKVQTEMYATAFKDMNMALWIIEKQYCRKEKK